MPVAIPTHLFDVLLRTPRAHQKPLLPDARVGHFANFAGVTNRPAPRAAVATSSPHVISGDLRDAARKIYASVLRDYDGSCKSSNKLDSSKSLDEEKARVRQASSVISMRAKLDHESLINDLLGQFGAANCDDLAYAVMARGCSAGLNVGIARMVGYHKLAIAAPPGLDLEALPDTVDFKNGEWPQVICIDPWARICTDSGSYRRALRGKFMQWGSKGKCLDIGSSDGFVPANSGKVLSIAAREPVRFCNISTNIVSAILERVRGRYD